ncbi:MAG: hypothetical protein ACOX47_08465 [Bacillota bacterium]
MINQYEASDRIFHSYICARCKNSFEAARPVASTCPICGYSGSENLTSESDIVPKK